MNYMVYFSQKRLFQSDTGGISIQDGFVNKESLILTKIKSFMIIKK